MPEALKNMYNEIFVTALSNAFQQVHPTFDVQRFSSLIFDHTWQDKELKQRTRCITEALYACLPSDYVQSIAILKDVIIQLHQPPTQLHGYECVIFPDFVEAYGLDHYDISVAALAFFTPYPSSEFAVRPFILKYPEKMMQQMKVWAKHDSEHVRRLATEGCRPRLPWSMSLPLFKEDPTPVLDILVQLKNDESLYVRRSVANNLNDISKDHPQIVIDIAKAWLGQNKDTDWLVKHGCRTLLKQGHPEVLALFGFTPAQHINIQDFELTPDVAWGDMLNFSALLSSKQPLGKLRLEFAIDFMKANGKQARKVFKIAESNYQETSKKIQKSFSFKAISTRKYYAGEHQLALIINGEISDKKKFILQPL